MGSKPNAPPPAALYGSTGQTTYKIIGKKEYTGPDGQTYQVPRYESRTSLSPDQQTQIGSDMNDLAMSHMILQNHLGLPVDYTGLTSVDND